MVKIVETENFKSTKPGCEPIPKICNTAGLYCYTSGTVCDIYRVGAPLVFKERLATRAIATRPTLMRTSPSHVHYPWQASYDGDFNRRRGLYIKAVQPKMPAASSFSKTGRYRVPSTLARRQQFSWRRNQPEPLPKGLRTAVATTTSRPPSESSRTEVSAPEGARKIQQGPQPKELHRLPRPKG